jgi:hypothetical protein
MIMNPINNSDTAWLIVSDYNQDNGIFYEDLREDVLNPNVNQWHWISIISGVGTNFDPVGGQGGGDRTDASDNPVVGSLASQVGCRSQDIICSQLVGGLNTGGVGDNYYDPHKPIRYSLVDCIRLQSR